MLHHEYFLLYNTKHKTYPNLIHAQNLRLNHIKEKFQYICLNLSKNKIKSLENQLTVITTTNKKDKSFLQMQMESFNHKYFYILGQEINDWDFVCKFELISKFLKNIETKYILFCDSHDVAIFQINGIIEKFQQLNCCAIFNAEYTFWPNLYFFQLHNTDDELPSFIKCHKREELISINSGCDVPMYLNSGVWLCSTDYAKYMLNTVDKNVLNKYKFEHSGKICPNDQPFFREIFHNCYPDIKLDYKSFLFQTLVADFWNNNSNSWEKKVHMEKEINFFYSRI